MSADRRKVANRAEAMELLALWEKSGVGLARFSHARGIDGRSLRCWALNLGRKTPAPKIQPQKLRLLELSVPPGNIQYRVSIGDIHIEVSDDFRDESLARLLAVVKRC